MHCVIHLGTEKTGTTSIQKALSANRSLLDNHNVLVGWPEDLQNSRYLSLGSSDTRDEFWDWKNWQSLDQKNDYVNAAIQWLDFQIASNPGRFRLAVFSSEHFHSRVREESQFSWLRNFFLSRFQSVHFVCYLRPQDDLLTSLYSTTLRNGSARSLESFQRAVQKDDYYFNYEAMLERWTDAFPSATFSVREYQASSVEDWDVVSDFFEVAQLPSSGHDPGKPVLRENRRFSTVQIGLFRILNLFLRRNKSRSHLSQQGLWTAILRAIEQSNALSRMGTSRRVLHTLQAKYREGNLRISEEYGIHPSFWSS